MSVIMLPICEKPILVYDEKLSMSLAVLEGQGVDIYPWLVCRYGNIKYNQINSSFFYFCEEDPWFVEDKLFIKSLFSYDQGMCGADRDNVIDIVSYSIEHGECIVGTFDAFYVPAKNEYKKLHRHCNYLIYGVDTDLSLLYLIGQNDTLNLVKYTLEFNDFWEALRGNGKPRIEFNSFRLNSSFVFESDFLNLQKSLSEFLGATSQRIQHALWERSVFGLAALRKMREYFCEIGIVHEFVDRNIYLKFFDFQTMTALRCEKIGCYMALPELIQMSTRLRALSMRFVELCKQYNNQKSIGLVAEMVRLFDEIVALDKSAVEYMLSHIKDVTKAGNLS